MTDKNPGNKNSSEYRREASNSLLGIISNTSELGKHLYEGLLAWSEENPILSKLIAIPVIYLVTEILLTIFGYFYNYFFANNVVASMDIQVQTHPLPIGLSLNILFVLLLFATFLIYLRIATLRRRIEELEKDEA